MVQRGEHFGLALKAGQPIGVGRQCLWQDLDGDLPLQARVGRPPDLAHSPFADLVCDFVDTKTGAGREGHLVEGLYGVAWRADD